MANLRRFITAYNAGSADGALAQVSPTQPLAFSDCDYATQQLVYGHGRVQLTNWLRTNIADHDRLTIDNIDANPDQPLGVLGVSFSRRSSDAITRSGHPNGITPVLGAKVKFDRDGLLTEFNNGPYGGGDACLINQR